MKAKLILSVFCMSFAIAHAADNNQVCKIGEKEYSIGAIVKVDSEIYQCVIVFLKDPNAVNTVGWVKVDSDLKNKVP